MWNLIIGNYVFGHAREMQIGQQNIMQPCTVELMVNDTHAKRHSEIYPLLVLGRLSTPSTRQICG